MSKRAPGIFILGAFIETNQRKVEILKPKAATLIIPIKEKRNKIHCRAVRMLCLAWLCLSYLLVPQYPLPLSTLGSIILGAELPNANSMLLLLFFL